MIVLIYKKNFSFAKTVTDKKYIFKLSVSIQIRRWHASILKWLSPSIFSIFLKEHPISLNANWHFHPRWLYHRHVSLPCLGILPSSFTRLFCDRNDSSFISLRRQLNSLLSLSFFAYLHNILFLIYFIFEHLI